MLTEAQKATLDREIAALIEKGKEANRRLCALHGECSACGGPLLEKNPEPGKCFNCYLGERGIFDFDD